MRTERGLTRGGVLPEHAASAMHRLRLVVVLFWIPLIVSAAVRQREGSTLADLPSDVLDALTADGATLPDGPEDILDRIFEVSPTYEFNVGALAVETDLRWYATIPPEEPGAPLLELRRWPGDTLVAFFAVEAGASGPAPGPGTVIPGARLEASEALWGGVRRWKGVLDTQAGARPIEWLERTIPDLPRRVGALVFPGDAGLDSTAPGELALEGRKLLQHVEVNPEAWRQISAVSLERPILLPELDLPPGERDERRDPWQVVDAGAFTLGLPPGIRARRLDTAVPAPRPIDGAVLWLRGRFLDRTGERVSVGDGSRVGYVAKTPREPARWRAASPPPLLGAPKAVRVDSIPLESLVTEPTGADLVLAEHWREEGFAGEWLVFRMAFDDRGIEIALPVLSSWRSLALFWIPVTLRAAGRPPAPPPIDPAARFGIRLDRLTRAEQRVNPFLEGYLEVPGLRLEIPKGWWPVASLRSEDGFPILLFDPAGRPAVRLVPEGRASSFSDGKAAWTPLEKPQRFGASAASVLTDRAILLRSRDGVGFVLEKTGEAEIEPGTWKRLIESVTLRRVIPR